MSTQRVPESTAIDMIGPYLVAQAQCPFCSSTNRLLHTEGPTSPVKVHEVCKHIRGYGIDDDGDGYLLFDDTARG